MIFTTTLHLTDASYVGDARRHAVQLGASIKLEEAWQHRIALVVTELATNLVKHAGRGRLVMNCGRLAGEPWFQAISIDSGPGIEDTRRCFEDGYSTAGSPGTGLGAVLRMSQRVDIHSTPKVGTVIAAEICAPVRGPVELGAVSLPCEGETVCGDAWQVTVGERMFSMTVADGLGHGPLACEAAQSVVESYDAAPFTSPHETLERMHSNARPTRGAAAAVAVIDSDSSVLRYAGIGNIVGFIAGSGETRRMVSHHGTLGHVAQRFVDFEYPLTPASLIIMHSDGIGTHWSLDDWPQLGKLHPAVIAGVIARDQWRMRDDATVLAVRRRA
jgi:anti-sigma regulatory factor (Ser/Thr protein kinase)